MFAVPLVCSLLAPSLTFAHHTPEHFAKVSVEETIRFAEESHQQEEDFSEFFTLLRKKVENRLAVSNMLSRILGEEQWDDLGLEQKAFFREEFVRYLLCSYGDKLFDYIGYTVQETQVVDEDSSERTVFVKVRIFRTVESDEGIGLEEVGFTQRLLREDGSWRLSDLEGRFLSAVKYFKFFATFRSNQGYLKYLRRKGDECFK